jgi:hypothetical protein
MLKKSPIGHGPCRVKREICEKGAKWTDWAPTSFGLSRSSRMSPAAFFSILLVQLSGDGVGLEAASCR